MQTRKLGSQGLEVTAIGYGAMVLEGYYGGVGDAEAIETIRQALDLGVSHIDTADAYGGGHNEGLIKQALAGRPRESATIATKFGIVFDGTPGRDLVTGWGHTLTLNGEPAYVQKSLDRSLQTLGVDVIDLWYLHYPDPATPIEETVAAMAEGVRAGKVRYLGLSNLTAEQLRRAHAVHPISAVQYEYSLWRREAELELLPTMRELGIGLVPWSPLGSGFLTGSASVGENDFRQINPRFQGENRVANEDRFAPLHEMAKRLGITSAQLALAWVLHQGDDIAPIPGTRKAARIAENAAAASVVLSAADLAYLNDLAPVGATAGGTLV
ncbi:MAG: aldo/keto reductase [Chloroflexaceae bacterium]|jgi:aryl-alcohol dehydrogenase-like predicted oxidoreductase|nr:aldo/keto reductase [Chloroflexaceae bacterium]